jgi:hypothetical protein
MKPFRDKFIAKWKEEFVVPLERDLGVKLANYRGLLQGQFTFAVTQNGWEGGKDGNQPATLLLLDAREKGGQLKTNLTELRKKWVDSGKSVKTETIRGVDFWIISASSNNVPRTLRKFFPQRQEIQEKGKEDEPQPASGNIVIGQYESLLIVGSSVKSVENVVARLTGSAVPALADEAAFDVTKSTVFRGAPLFVWVNTKRIFDVVAAAPLEEPNPEAPSPVPSLNMGRILKATGLAEVKTLALAWRSSADGLGLDLFIGAPESTRSGLFKVLAADARDSNPPAFVPAEVMKFQRWRMDCQKAIATLEKMLGEISPQALGVWNFIISTGDAAGKEGDPAFDLRKNLFGNLGNDIISYSRVPRGNSPQQLGSPPSLVLLGSANAEQMAASLKGLMAILSPNAKPKEREFLGKKIYMVTLSRMPFGASSAAGTSLSYVASGGYVAISADAAMLEEYLRSAETPPKPLRELAGLADAAQKTGGQSTGLFSYENQVETTRTTFRLLKTSASTSTNDSATFNPLTASVPFAGPEKTVREWLDFSLLPDFEKVSKYFYFSVCSGAATADGITYKFFAPTPPALKQ